MRSWSVKLALLVASLLSPALASAQPGPLGSGHQTGALDSSGANMGQWERGRMFTPSIDFLQFNSTNRDRFYPSFSYDGGNTFTRDPGAFSGRRDRAHAARVMTAEEFRRQRALDNWRPSTGVILVQGRTEGAAGLTYGVFQDGRWTMAQGDLGQINLDVLRAEAEARGNLQANLTDGLMARGNAEARAILVGVNGQTNTGRLGGNLLGADISASGRADVLAEAQAEGVAALNTSGLRLRGEGELFAGARARGQIPVGFSLLGVRFGATGRGQASAGIGIEGDARAEIANGGIRAGCGVGGCLGVGAGVGVDLEIDASVAIRNIGEFFDGIGSGGGYRQPEDFRPRYVGPGLVSSVNCIGSRCTQRVSPEYAERIRQQENDRYSNLSAFFANPRTGSQPGRYSPTQMSDADRELIRQILAGPRGNAGPASSAGTAGALGR